MATSGIKISNLTCSDVISAGDLVALVHEGTTYHTAASTFLTSQIVNLDTVTTRGNTTTNSLSVANLTASDTFFNTSCLNNLQSKSITLSSGTGYAEIKTKNTPRNSLQFDPASNLCIYIEDGVTPSNAIYIKSSDDSCVGGSGGIINITAGSACNANTTGGGINITAGSAGQTSNGIGGNICLTPGIGGCLPTGRDGIVIIDGNLSASNIVGNTTIDSLSVLGDANIHGNSTIYGSLSVCGDLYTTLNVTTSSISVISFDGDPPLVVQQYYNPGEIAHFIDVYGDDIVFDAEGRIGVNTRTPNEKITVVGNISATGNISTQSSFISAGRDLKDIFNTDVSINLDDVTTVGNTTTNSIEVGKIITGNNISTGPRSSAIGGQNNTALSADSIVLGGSKNIASGLRSTAVGGINLSATNEDATVIGGSCNKATNIRSSVIGGLSSLATGIGAIVLGGVKNEAEGLRSAVIGGQNNTVTHQDSVVIGTNITSSANNTLFVNNLDVEDTITTETLSATTIHAVSSFVEYIDIKQYELSGFDVTGNVSISGSMNVTENIEVASLTATGNITTGNNIATGLRSSAIGGNNLSATGIDSTAKGGSGNKAVNLRSSAIGGQNNTALSADSIVLGGKNNLAGGERSFIIGGFENTATGLDSEIIGGSKSIAIGDRTTTVGGLRLSATNTGAIALGGVDNCAAGVRSAIIGGQNNTVTQIDSFIIGSNITSSAACTTFVNNLSSQGTVCGAELYDNGNRVCTTAEADTLQSVTDRGFTTTNSLSVASLTANGKIIGGAPQNRANGDYAAVLGGVNIYAIGSHSNVTGGINNSAVGACSHIGGGCSNYAMGNYSNVAGGSSNKACCGSDAVAGGYYNCAQGSYSFVGGGANNTAGGDSSNVAGGSSNTACGNSSNVAGGYGNKACGTGSNVAGGTGNYAIGNCSTVGGGFNNAACGDSSAILGGTTNTILSAHEKSFIIGSNITSSAACTTFVNNLTAQGNIYAGSALTQTITAGNMELTICGGLIYSATDVGTILGA